VQLSTVLLIKYKIKYLVQELLSFTIITLFELYYKQEEKKKEKKNKIPFSWDAPGSGLSLPSILKRSTKRICKKK
jgi:hypothetical protein